MRKRVDEDPQALELLNTADANLDNMQNVINEFLDMAALQSGKIDLHMEEVTVETVLNDLLRQYHLNALKKDIDDRYPYRRRRLCRSRRAWGRRSAT